MTYHDWSANQFLNDLIRAVDQRSYNGSDYTNGNASKTSDRDPTATV